MLFPSTPAMIETPDICAEFETRKAALPGCFAPFFVPMKGGCSPMDRNQLLDLLASGPVIAAVKSEDGLAAALESDVSVIFLLSGDILTVADAAARVRKAGKRAFVHLDLVDGLAAREVSVDFIARQTAADGIISTKAALTRRGRELGLVTIQRFFLLDSMALENIEKDLAECVYAAPDFITIDGRGGATGSSPLFLREATSIPTIYALHRARTYLDSVHSDIELIITGGLRVSSDFAKALAMGADAVAIASAGLIAAACQQYRICGSGNCPVGIATQDPELRSRLHIDAAAQRTANFLNVTLEELKTFARITGHSSVHDLIREDLVTLNRDIEEYTGIPHAGKPQQGF